MKMPAPTLQEIIDEGYLVSESCKDMYSGMLSAMVSELQGGNGTRKQRAHLKSCVKHLTSYIRDKYMERVWS